MKRLVIASILISIFAVAAPLRAEPLVCEIKESKKLSKKEKKDIESWIRVGPSEESEAIYVPTACEEGDPISFTSRIVTQGSRAAQICQYDSLKMFYGYAYAGFNCIYQGKDKILKMR